MATGEIVEKRRFGIRRDLNSLVRGKDGEISGSKIGTYAAQYISAKLLLGFVALPTWDVLAVLFFVLIAPEAYKQLMMMKWGGNAGTGFTERTERTEHTTTATRNEVKG